MADAMNENEGQPSGFPKTPSDFDADDRVSFSKVDNKFLLETDEGTEYEWDSALRRWIPVVGSLVFPSVIQHATALDPTCRSV